ncbi:MAG: DUF2189 domain-containing protein [Rubrivivax sp.]|nr:DUF2189 domain-containing protein [Rubrivivax sp.]
MRDPFLWLCQGWADFRRAPAIGLFYGGCFTVMGWALMKVYEQAPAYLLALSAGFLLVAPFLCLGIYHVSRELQAGRRPDFGASLMAWESRMGQLGIFAFVLLVLEMLWARSTLVIFAVTFDGMPDFKGSISALFNPENMTFIVAWAVVGAIFATLIFSVSVVSMPMLLDRPTDAITAALTSLRLVLTRTPVMFFWGALIAAITFTAMVPWFTGLVVVAPVIGHASWHAYRAAVAA